MQVMKDVIQWRSALVKSVRVAVEAAYSYEVQVSPDGMTVAECKATCPQSLGTLIGPWHDGKWHPEEGEILAAGTTHFEALGYTLHKHDKA